MAQANLQVHREIRGGTRFADGLEIVTAALERSDDVEIEGCCLCEMHLLQRASLLQFDGAPGS